ncbi:MAG: pilin [Patescibacteria group bacterium]
MKKIAKIVLSSLILTMVFSMVVAISSVSVLAQGDNTIQGGLDSLASGAQELPSGTTDLKQAIGQIIQIFLGFLGVLAVVLIIYAGFLWMTAGGDSAKVDKAKGYIKNAIIGIVIILAAYIITSYVLTQIVTTLGN